LVGIISIEIVAKTKVLRRVKNLILILRTFKS
jgi:hypothetical protein